MNLPLLLLAAVLVYADTAAADPAPAGAEAADDFAGFEEEFAPPKPVFDPLRHWNRAFFHVNDKFYFWLAKPAARAYGWAVPEAARKSVDRGFHNLHYPLRLAGCLLQLKLRRAGVETGRFLVNSTLGLGGLFDPAERWLGWRRPPDEDLGQALGAWGVGPGFPFTIPILGPSNLRDGLMYIPAIYLSPVPYVTEVPVSVGVSAGEKVNYLSMHVGEYESAKKDALDPYAFIRDAYQAAREKDIKE